MGHDLAHLPHVHGPKVSVKINHASNGTHCITP
jgi:hypothetical protein